MQPFLANYQISPQVGGTFNHTGAYTAHKAFRFPTARVSETNSSDLCHFSISAHTTLPDYNRLTHIPHTPYFTLHWGGVGWGLLAWYRVAQFSCRAGSGSSEIVWGDGVNKLLVLQRWAAEVCLAEASKSSRSLQPIHTGQKRLRKQLEMSEHTPYLQ